MSGQRALDALLEGAVDYAGLFPPASQSMADAVAAYARYRDGAHRALLGRFVVPAARLGEFAAALAALRALREALDGALGSAPAAAARAPWRLSVLAGAADLPALEAFDAAHAGVAAVDMVEAKAESADGVAALAPLGARYTTYVELPVRDDPAPLVRAVVAHGMRAKIRTGGLSADAFPAPDEVVRFLVACRSAGARFKATAGLHHPMRGEYALTYEADAARGTMYGFLNLLLAAALLREGAAPERVTALLQEREPGALLMDATKVRWRSETIGRDALAAARADFVDSFGSCSFEEPVQDLGSLGFL